MCDRIQEASNEQDQCAKLKFHGSSFPRSVLVTASRGCHEDATRKMVPWSLSFIGHDSQAVTHFG